MISRGIGVHSGTQLINQAQEFVGLNILYIYLKRVKTVKIPIHVFDNESFTISLYDNLQDFFTIINPLMSADVGLLNHKETRRNRRMSCLSPCLRHLM